MTNIIIDGKEYKLVPCEDVEKYDEPDLEDTRVIIRLMADLFKDNDWTYSDGDSGEYTPDEYDIKHNINRMVWDLEDSKENTFIESGRLRVEKDDELDGFYRVKLIAEEFLIKPEELKFL